MLSERTGGLLFAYRGWQVSDIKIMCSSQVKAGALLLNRVQEFTTLLLILFIDIAT